MGGGVVASVGRPITKGHYRLLEKNVFKFLFIDYYYLRGLLCWVFVAACRLSLVAASYSLGFPGGASGKEPPVNAGDRRDTGLTPGLGRSPGGENDNPLQYPCLENSMGRGAWWAAKSQT